MEPLISLLLIAETQLMMCYQGEQGYFSLSSFSDISLGRVFWVFLFVGCIFVSYTLSDPRHPGSLIYAMLAQVYLHMDLRHHLHTGNVFCFCVSLRTSASTSGFLMFQSEDE